MLSRIIPLFIFMKKVMDISNDTIKILGYSVLWPSFGFWCGLCFYIYDNMKKQCSNYNSDWLIESWVFSMFIINNCILIGILFTPVIVDLVFYCCKPKQP